MACPPLKALLHIMVSNQFEGRSLNDPVIRSLFTQEAMLASEWYADRLRAKQSLDVKRWQRHAGYLEHFIARANYALEAERLGLPDRLDQTWKRYHDTKDKEYLSNLFGTLGVQPLASSVPVAP